MTYGIVQGGCPAGATCSNLVTSDPLFVQQPPIDIGTTGNLRLQACSPAAETGSDPANSTATDLDGNARKIDAITGGTMIDMGAYEYQGDLDRREVIFEKKFSQNPPLSIENQSITSNPT